jgi:hypothetical protein
MGVLGEGDSVGEVVVAAAGELVDLAGIDNGAGGDGKEALAGCPSQTVIFLPLDILCSMSK